MMTTKEAAIKWFTELSSLEKTRQCDTHTELIGRCRRYESLTGEEIQKIWMQEMVFPWWENDKKYSENRVYEGGEITELYLKEHEGIVEVKCPHCNIVKPNGNFQGLCGSCGRFPTKLQTKAYEAKIVLAKQPCSKQTDSLDYFEGLHDGHETDRSDEQPEVSLPVSEKVIYFEQLSSQVVSCSSPYFGIYTSELTKDEAIESFGNALQVKLSIKEKQEKELIQSLLDSLVSVNGCLVDFHPISKNWIETQRANKAITKATEFLK